MFFCSHRLYWLGWRQGPWLWGRTDLRIQVNSNRCHLIEISFSRLIYRLWLWWYGSFLTTDSVNRCADFQFFSVGGTFNLYLGVSTGMRVHLCMCTRVARGQFTGISSCSSLWGPGNWAWCDRLGCLLASLCSVSPCWSYVLCLTFIYLLLFCVCVCTCMTMVRLLLSDRNLWESVLSSITLVLGIGQR